MVTVRARCAALGLALAWAAIGAPAAAQSSGWVLALPDTARLPGPRVRLGDLNLEPLPAAAAELLLAGEGRPGQTVEVDRRVVLRRLVEAGLAAGVERCDGAQRCLVAFTGQGADEAQLRARLTELLAPWLPTAPAGAPAAWLEIELQAPAVAQDDWTLELTQPRPLRPGRNLVPVRLADGARAARITASVVCHVYGELPKARAAVPAGAPLAAELFGWEWSDLNALPPGLVVGREAVAGRSLTRALSAGETPRGTDLRTTPLVRQGDPVDLAVRRGVIVATVRATARQDGALGAIITVRNEVSGQLTTARVTGPGEVEWRR